jgi:hypothetical protein
VKSWSTILLHATAHSFDDLQCRLQSAVLSVVVLCGACAGRPPVRTWPAAIDGVYQLNGTVSGVSVMGTVAFRRDQRRYRIESSHGVCEREITEMPRTKLNVGCEMVRFELQLDGQGFRERALTRVGTVDRGAVGRTCSRYEQRSGGRVCVAWETKYEYRTIWREGWVDVSRELP